MRAERFGSYSIVATLPGTPNLSRLKSMRRIFCLCPPPWCRIVRSPELRRPPVRLRVVSSGLCGLSVVRSSFTCVVLKRRVGVIGLYVLIAIVFVLGSAPSFQLLAPAHPAQPTSVNLLPNFAPAPFRLVLEARSCSYRLLTYSGSFSPAFNRT